MITSLDTKKLINIFLNAEKIVTAKKETLNNLNVYPVPDGDTGTNMSLTLKEIVYNIDIKKEYTLKELSDIIAESSLMGGRGNSGVILSQFLDGFCNVIQDHKKINKDTLNKAFKKGTVEAYASVSNPVEGTILTIMKAASDEFNKYIEYKDISKILANVINKSQYVLKQTPDMLDKLKDAGVVDAGGAGFVFFLEGFYESLLNKTDRKISATDDYSSPKLTRIWDETIGIFGPGGIRSLLEFNYQAIKFTLENTWWLIKKGWEVVKIGKDFISVKKSIRLIKELSKQLKLQNIKKSNLSIKKLLKTWQETPDEKYCCEAILTDVDYSVPEIKDKISKTNGTSAIVANKGKYTKIHFHSKTRKDAQKLFESLGTIKKTKFDNLHKQHKEFINQKIENSDEQNGTTVISVINSKGFREIYKSIEGIVTLDGGNTMNPSLSDFKKVIKDIDCKNIIILPNNKNIFMVAKKLKSDNKNIQYIETYDQAQGLCTLLNFNKNSNLSENKELMLNSLKSIKTFSVTKSNKQVSISKQNINKNDYFTINQNGVIKSNNKIDKVILDTIKELNGESELITLYYGDLVSKEKSIILKNNILKKFNTETQIYYGGQPHYHYIFSLE